ncbi:hypothetical protein WA026_012517 [Henosepilachna vigintioctopunctata]|uniref:Endonuclease/exonuclease/phosphatase domain-containing protein n=1 Tax=Henosepilachna vigintioctopunctata TaxID=420089 RepID=A0AAW1U6I8_9CUCU
MKDTLSNVSSHSHTHTVSCDDIVCGGDLNFNFMDVDDSPTKILLDNVQSLNLLVTIATRISGLTDTLFDVICISDKIEVLDVSALDESDISDHHLATCSLGGALLTAFTK